MTQNQPKNQETENEEDTLPFNSPTSEEVFLFHIDLDITRYDPERPEETFLSRHEMSLGNHFVPGRRITWYPTTAQDGNGNPVSPRPNTVYRYP